MDEDNIEKYTQGQDKLYIRRHRHSAQQPDEAQYSPAWRFYLFFKGARVSTYFSQNFFECLIWRQLNH